MILVVDMGNTHTVLGGYEGEQLVFELRMATNRKATSDEWGLTVLQLLERQKVNLSAINGIAYASVVPQLEWAMQNAFQRYLGQRHFVWITLAFPKWPLKSTVQPKSAPTVWSMLTRLGRVLEQP